MRDDPISFWAFAGIAAAAMSIGILGTLVPVIPGLFLAWGAATIFTLLVEPTLLTWLLWAGITALAAFGTFLGIRVPQKDAAAEGLTVPEQLFAVALAIAGTVFVPVPVIGTAGGFALGVYLAKWRSVGDAGLAWSSTKRIFRAMAKASGYQFLAGVAMFTVFAVMVIQRRPTG